MNLEMAWYGNRKVADQFTPSANCSTLEGNALKDSILERLDKELPHSLYLDQTVLAQLIRLSPKTLANRRALNPERYPAPLYISGSKKPLFPRADVIEWLAQQEYQAKVSHRHKCA